MKKRVLLSYAIGIALFALFILTAGIDLSIIVRVKNPFLLALGIVFVLFNFVVLSWRLKYLLKPFNRVQGFWMRLRIQFIDKFVTHFAPSRANIPVKALALSKVTGSGKTEGLSVSSFEFALDTGTVLFFTLLSLFFFLQGLPYDSTYNFFIFMAFALIAVLVFFLFPEHWFQRLQSGSDMRTGFFHRLISKGFKMVHAVRADWKTMISHSSMYPVIFFTLLNWVVGVLSTYFFFLSYGVDVPFGFIFAVNAAIAFVGGITQLPAGIGAREAAMVFLYGFLGYPTPVAAAVAVVSRLAVYVIVLAGYFWAVQGVLESKPAVGSFKRWP